MFGCRQLSSVLVFTSAFEKKERLALSSFVFSYNEVNLIVVELHVRAVGNEKQFLQGFNFLKNLFKEAL